MKWTLKCATSSKNNPVPGRFLVPVELRWPPAVVQEVLLASI
jgi:hypothetical protein